MLIKYRIFYESTLALRSNQLKNKLRPKKIAFMTLASFTLKSVLFIQTPKSLDLATPLKQAQLS